MMPLIEGLQLQSDVFDEINVFLSTGCIEQSNKQPSGEKCFFPRNHWLKPTDLELEKLLSPKLDLPLNRSVTVIKVNPELQKECLEIIIPEMMITQNQQERGNILNSFGNRILHSLNETYGLITESLRSFDLTINGPNQESTAFNYNTKRFIGLHIDNHEKLSLTRRKAGFQLLNINFGENDRYFQYINFEVETILSFLDIHVTDKMEEQFHNIYKLKDAFLSSAYINYPVVRVQLKPSQAYITVTQNLIHDGATNNQGSQDISFLIGGFFSLKS